MVYFNRKEKDIAKQGTLVESSNDSTKRLSAAYNKSL